METAATNVEVDDVHRSIAAILTAGLPARLYDPVDELLELRGVIARSVKPDDRASRLDTLNNLLKRLIRRWQRPTEGKALAALYGVEKGYGGRTLTDRRHRAATHLGYSPTHFRKEVEPRLVADFATALWQDHIRYTPRTRYAPPPIAGSGDTPILDPGDYTEQEELASRVWSEVYALRAAIIAGGRVRRDFDRGTLSEVRGRILWHTARLAAVIERYLQSYGDRIVQGETAWNVEGLIRLSGWRGGLQEQESYRLRKAIAISGFDDYRRFIATLTSPNSEDDSE